MSGSPPHNTRFSFARLALFSLGSGAAVLVISIPIISVVARSSPVWGLVIALIAILVTIAVMGLVARRMVERAAQVSRSAHAARPKPAAPNEFIDTDTEHPNR